MQPASSRHGTCWAPLAQRSALGHRAVLPASQRESCASFWVLRAPLPKPQWHLPLGACPSGLGQFSRSAAPPARQAQLQGVRLQPPTYPAGSYLVRCPQQPMDPSQLGAQSQVLAECEQRWPAGLWEVGAVERIGVVQELHATSQRGHDASLPRGARAPGSAGRAGRGAGSVQRRSCRRCCR